MMLSMTCYFIVSS